MARRLQRLVRARQWPFAPTGMSWDGRSTSCYPSAPLRNVRASRSEKTRPAGCEPASRQFKEGSMARQLNITYYADRDMLGLVSDEDYEQFKDLLLEALHKEWPKATIAVEDGEHAGIEVEFASGDFPTAKAEQDAKSDVESRVHEIANDVIEEREWATEDEYE